MIDRAWETDIFIKSEGVTIMVGEQTQETKGIKVSYYLTLVAEVELEIPEGENEEKVVRDYLPDIAAHKLNVVTADYAEMEDEEKGKRYIELT